MKRVLWVSRQDLLEDQKKDLERIYGDVEIKRFNWSVQDIEEILEAGEGCDVIAVVLPLPQGILNGLLNPRNNTKPVIRALINRIETGETVVNPDTGNEEKVVRPEFVAWERINKLIVDVTRVSLKTLSSQ